MPAREKLSADMIVETALGMLDSDGLNKFSMRKLAARLNVDPMAIYHHHKNKDALIHAVLEQMVAGCPIPPAGSAWQQDLRDLCQGLRNLARQHPGAFAIYETYAQWLPAEHALHEALFAILERAGFAAPTIPKAARLLLAYTEAFAVDEVSGWLELDRDPSYLESLKQGDYPTLTRLKMNAGPTDADADFTFGLDVLINGLEAQRDRA